MSSNDRIDQRLNELGIELPEPPSPVGDYIAVHHAGHLIFVSGQIPLEAGKLKFTGKVGSDLTVEEGQAAARLCAVNALAQIRKSLGSWEDFGGIVRMSGYVASAEGFTGQAQVMDSASRLMTDVLGDRAAHARLAMGVSELPLGAPVELEVIAKKSESLKS